MARNVCIPITDQLPPPALHSGRTVCATLKSANGAFINSHAYWHENLAIGLAVEQVLDRARWCVADERERDVIEVRRWIDRDQGFGPYALEVLEVHGPVRSALTRVR